ncbi:single-stranded DNA-binding protein [Desulfurococcaceae archaeon MEX13E-LK6-19]|nr:single-stranded DNA-binding protein [Desulfurococcaceae archaeon MEX13E-LK6-19]
MSQNVGKEKTPVINLKPKQEDVHIIVRVLEAGPTRVIQTRKGPRTISNAILGDETGRVRATLWGRKAGTLKEGQVVDITGAWTTAYRGQVQINIGSSTTVRIIDEDIVPPKEEIPEDSPKAPEEPKGFSRRQRGFRRTSWR